MRIELLPSSIPVTDSQFLVTFLVNQEIAIDGGSIGLLADLHRQERIKHVFITHEHLDHIATLPLFLENIYQPGPDCVEVLATADVLKFLHNDIFNGRVWPDFFQLSQPEDGFMNTAVLEPMQPVQRAGLTITPVVVAHGVETLGLVVIGSCFSIRHRAHEADMGVPLIAKTSESSLFRSQFSSLACCPRSGYGPPLYDDICHGD